MTVEEMNTRFSYHTPKPGQAETYQQIRSAARDLAWLISDRCPESREQSLAFTALEEAMFWANASIARRS